MKNKYLKRLFIRGRVEGKNLTKQQIFKEKVKAIMSEEDDFRSLYDFDAIENMNEDEKKEYLKNILQDYLYVKNELLNEKSFKEII